MNQVIAYKVDSLTNLKPNSIIALKVAGVSKFELFITDLQGAPHSLNLPATTGVQQIINTDGALQVVGSTNVVINLEPAILASINSALQVGDNISALLNDAGYITSLDLPTKTSDLTNDGEDGTSFYIEDTDVRLSDARTPLSHTHTESDITDLDKYTQAQTDNLLDDKLDKDISTLPSVTLPLLDTDKLIVNRVGVDYSVNKSELSGLTGEQGIQGVSSNETILYSAVNNSAATTYEQDEVVMFTSYIEDLTSTRTFNVTVEGTAGGTAIFDDLTTCSIQLTASRNTDANNESPWVHVKSVSSKQVVAQVKKSNTGGVLLGGSYYGNLNNTNSVRVYIQIIGKKNSAL